MNSWPAILTSSKTLLMIGLNDKLIFVFCHWPVETCVGNYVGLKIMSAVLLLFTIRWNCMCPGRLLYVRWLIIQLFDVPFCRRNQNLLKTYGAWTAGEWKTLHRLLPHTLLSSIFLLLFNHINYKQDFSWHSNHSTFIKVGNVILIK